MVTVGRRSLVGLVIGITAVWLHLSGLAPAAANGPTCFGVPATIVGTEADDVLYGSNGDDVIVSLGGRDEVHSHDGNDRICTGPNPLKSPRVVGNR